MSTRASVSTRLFWITVIAVGITATATFGRWWPVAEGLVRRGIAGQKTAVSEDEHAGHEPAGGGDSIELSPQAMKELGLTAETLKPIRLESYRRSITVPGIVVERPGRTRVEASTPIAGVITHVHAVQGEAVAPGTLLFQMRITADALVSTQTELLRTVGELDVETREVARITKALETGAVANRILLERQYAKEKLESQLNAQREGLRLLGLSERQIEDIVVHRKVLKELQITAPEHDDHSEGELKLSETAIERAAFQSPPPAQETPDHRKEHGLLVLREVRVHKGETVAAGQTLAVMTDNAELFVEGRAFEQDSRSMIEAARKDWKVSAIFDNPGGETATVEGLDFAYTGGDIDAVSRTLPFYVRLPNVIERTVKLPDGQQFIDWRYRLGQRLQLRIPIEEWTNRFVLPVDAVARDGLDSYVFRQSGKKFSRVRVTVEYRDQTSVVIADDSQLYPGNVVAVRGAHQLQMALKNRSGGGVDPHAGHTH